MSTSERHEPDPVVVPMGDTYEMTMDEWLRGLRGDQSLALAVSTAQLLADARAESE